MRIVAGKHAGRHLTSPAKRIRPTAETVRDRWLGRLKDDLEGARVLDLFAGSGALGLEALSRGAASVDFVENGAEALHSLKSQRGGAPGEEAYAHLQAGRHRLRRGAGRTQLRHRVCRRALRIEELDRIVDTWAACRFARILGAEHAEGPGASK